MNKFTDAAYDAIDAAVSKKLGLPSGLLSSIRLHGERSNADQVSSAGARTVYQVIPETRNSALKKWGIDAWESPENAAEVAGRLLKDSISRNNGSIPQAVGEYIGGLNRKNWGKTTQAYIGRVTTGMKRSLKGEIEQLQQQNQVQRPDSVSQKVFEARANGYDDKEIFNFLRAKNPQYKEAKQAGYSDDEIAAHFGLTLPAKQQPSAPAQENKGYFERLGSAVGDYATNVIKKGPISANVGAIETGVGAVTGAAGQIAGGLAGLGDLVTSPLTGRTGADAANTVKAVQDALTFSPKTSTGKALSNVAGIAIAEPIQMAGQGAGNATLNATGSPALAALIDTTIQGGSQLLPLPIKGIRGARGANIAATDIARPTEATLSNAALPTGSDALAARANAIQQAESVPVPNQMPARQPEVMPAQNTPVADPFVAEAPLQPANTLRPETVSGLPADMLNMKRSAPKEGGHPEQVQSRYEVLREIGLDDSQIRQGAVNGDSRLMGQEVELAKSDSPSGKAMSAQLAMEQERLNNYGDSIVDETGGTLGAEPELRGRTIIEPLQQYQDWFDGEISRMYQAADEAAAQSGGIQPTQFSDFLKRDSEWEGKAPNQSLRRGLRAYLNEVGITDGETLGTITAKQAEGIRQYLNSQWSPDSARLIGKTKEALDTDVISVLGNDAYQQARNMYIQRQRIFDDKGSLGKLVDYDGINRKVSYEKVGDKLAADAATSADQFRNIQQTLESLPEHLRESGQRALGEVRAIIAEKITGAKTPAALDRTFNPYKGKLREIFGDAVAKKLETYAAGVGILRKVDRNPSGTASMIENIQRRGAELGSTAAGSAIGGAVGGPIGAGAGGIIGQAIGAKLQTKLADVAEQKSLDQSLNEKQTETMRKVYEAKLNKVLSSEPMQQAIKGMDAGNLSPTAQRVVSAKIEKSKPWQDFVALLPKVERDSIRKLGIIPWLSTGANTAAQGAEKPKF